MKQDRNRRSEANSPANPINESGATRGPEKRDVYPGLARLDRDGLDAFEQHVLVEVEVEKFKQRHGQRWPDAACDELQNETRQPVRLMQFEDQEAREAFLHRALVKLIRRRGGRTTDQVKAAALLDKAGYLDYVADTNLRSPPGELRRMFPRAQHRAERDTEREKVALLLLDAKANRAERELRDRLRGFHAAVAAMEGTSLPEARKRAAREYGGVPQLPAEIRAEATKVIRDRRRQERRDAKEWRKQLGNLPDQEADEQARTLADWRRMSKKYGYGENGRDLFSDPD